MKILIHGNPVDGFHYVGPFQEVDDAIQWANTNSVDGDWWVADLEVVGN